MAMKPKEVLDLAQRTHKIERADLKALDLSNQTLDGTSFRQSELGETNLEGAKLRKCVFKGASLREANLARADLSETNLENADLAGARLCQAILTGANLTRANLEGADLEGAKLTGARLTHAQLDSAKLGGADLSEAVITYADLDDAYLGGARLAAADLTGASLKNANLEQADFQGAILDDARLIKARAHGAKFTKASLVKCNLTGAVLLKADLSDVDLRHAILAGGDLKGAKLTGAKIGGLTGTGIVIEEVEAQWIDTSPAGDGSQRVTNGEIPRLLASGPTTQRTSGAGARKHYFGPGDVIRDAVIEFADGARVEIESRFERCSITIGPNTELVIGEAGVLQDCKIVGRGSVTIHGRFFESESPGLVEPRQLVVTSQGAVIAAVQQGSEPTQFSFERGCRLRMKIKRPTTTANADGGSR